MKEDTEPEKDEVVGDIEIDEDDEAVKNTSSDKLSREEVKVCSEIFGTGSIAPGSNSIVSSRNVLGVLKSLSVTPSDELDVLLSKLGTYSIGGGSSVSASGKVIPS